MSTEYFNDQWRIPNNKNQSLVSNYSMKFDGITSVISVDNSDEALNPDYISISAWYYPTSIVVSSAIISSPNRGSGYHSYSIILASNGNLRVVFNTGSNNDITFTSAGSLNLNQWNFVCMTYDGSNVTLTLNTLSQSVAVLGALQYTVNPTGNIEIGRRNGLTFELAGILDQVCIFNYGLSASQVATLYGGGTAITNPMSLSPKPISYYQLGDQSVDNGANYLVPNNSLQDYVFEISPAGPKYFTMPSITISTTATISIWFNIKTLGSVQQTPFATTSSDKLSFRLSTNLQIIYADSSGFVSLITDIPPTNFLNKWHHLALVQDANGGTVYIDNVNKGVIGLKTPTFGAIGSPTDVNQSINGFVSNAAIFSTNLPATGTESIASLYNNGSPALDISSYSNLERWYKLNAADTFDGSNWTIKDYAGSNDGTSVNMTSANLVQSNLQQTSGYSPYALSLDKADGQRLIMSNGMQLGTNKAVSMWIKFNNGTGAATSMFTNGYYQQYPVLYTASGYLKIQICEPEPAVCTQITTTHTIVNDVWFNLIISGDGTTATVYVNGQNSGQGTDRTPSIIDVGNYITNAAGLDGDLSNLAVWQNNSLTSAEATEIFNSGRPSNLNNFSGTKPTAWWQLGSNSSFNATTSQWTCLDEIGTNNISTATNDMSEDDITNGVGYSGNGLGTSSIDIVGDAPYSSANGLSENMDVLDRTTDVPS